MSDDLVKLTVDGVSYSGWDSVSIKRSLNEPADSFELGVLDQWAGGNVRIHNGAAYQLYLDDALISTGYIDKVSRHYDDKKRSVKVRGRSKSADLVDCSYPIHSKPASWKNLSVLQVCNDIAKPFGIHVTDASGLADQKLGKLTVNPGDKAMDVIQSYLRGIGARIVSLSDGNLQIVNASKHKLATPLELGVNILSADDDDNLQNRFSVYHFVSQKSGKDKDSVTEYHADETDSMMSKLRYRPLTISADNQIDSQKEANARARVSRNVAAGESHTTTYELHGWRHADGIWEPNRQVKVVDAECGWNDWLIIGTVTLLLDDQGKRSHLTVLPISAYDITAEPQVSTGGA